MLGLASLAKLYYVYELPMLGHVFFSISLFIVLLLAGKLLFASAAIREELNNPIITSVSPTIPMGLMMLCSIFSFFGWSELIITTVWTVAALLQLMIVLYFSYRFMWGKWQLKNIFPSWFVTYIGLGVMPITAPFEAGWLHFVLYFIAASAVVLVPTVLYRVIVKKDIPEPAMPLITILAAPVSLILLAYLALHPVANETIVAGLLLVSQLLYLFVLVKLVTLLRLPFYPSYAAFTFPLVICATALYTVRSYFGWTDAATLWFAYTELGLATIIVSYVVIRYTRFIAH